MAAALTHGGGEAVSAGDTQGFTTSALIEREGESSSKYVKISRDNTTEEKKKMRKARKSKIQKQKIKSLRTEIKKEKELRVKAETNSSRYHCISRTYWERWRWELKRRRDLIADEISRKSNQPHVTSFVFPNIEPSMLKDPYIDGEQRECYVGRGSYGVVRLQVYHEIKVAVKEFLPRSVRDDVINEARILSSLCHPYLPCLLGVCFKEKPLRIITKFHAAAGSESSRTLFQEMRDKKLLCSELVFGFCVQLIEAVHYLHNEVEILHNDITTHNIVIEDDHIVLIDFGKGTKLQQATFYRLGEAEKQEYIMNYPHLAPEVIYGLQRQSVYSDMYSVGFVLHRVSNHSNLSSGTKMSVNAIAEKCKAIDLFKRPKSSEALKYFQDIVQTYDKTC